MTCRDRTLAIRESRKEENESGNDRISGKRDKKKKLEQHLFGWGLKKRLRERKGYATHLDEMQVLLVKEELHGFVWPLVDGGGGVFVAGAPVRSGDRRLGYVEGVLGPGPRGGRGVIQIEQAPGLFAGGGGVRGRGRRHDGLVEVGLEQADRALLGGLHRAGFRHLDGRRISKVRGRASARRTRRRCRRRRARRRSRAQRPEAGRLRRQGRLAGHWRPPVRAAVNK